ncbi:hypothetical protein OEM_46550 [Mycobacterium intracellulare subsp. yongonense 05-1390]|nr:hypothetical protein OEM_46550 [Mycobacterium intracellulare subsp. yongonense 05-1390]ARR80250.1 hypothetical protein MOTT12_04586 [Mycobacterium intracellulare subsp. yongonense]ARR85318.1 hypothetical protein MOTT27_04497 [Mycobacterium intracellulare subsp. yongonense]
MAIHDQPHPDRRHGSTKGTHSRGADRPRRAKSRDPANPGRTRPR